MRLNSQSLSDLLNRKRKKKRENPTVKQNENFAVSFLCFISLEKALSLSQHFAMGAN
jgi:hypothetical protein